MNRSFLAVTLAAGALIGVLVSAPPALAATDPPTVSFRNSRSQLPDNIYRAQL